jgi:hypothetical protein
MRKRTTALILGVIGLASMLAQACGRGGEPAEVYIKLSEPKGPIASATILVDYSQSGAKPLMKGGEVSCGAIVPNLSADFSDDGEGHLTIRARASMGFSPPVNLAVCRMIPDSASVTGDAIAAKLRITVQEGTDMAGAPLSAQRLAQTTGGGRDSRQEEPSGRGYQPPEGEAPEQGAKGAAPGGQAAGQAPQAAPGQAQTGGGSAGAGAPGSQAGGYGRPAGAPVPGGSSSAKGGLGVPAPGEGAAPSGAVDPGERRFGGGDNAAKDDGSEKGDVNDDSDADRAARTFQVTVGVTNSAGSLGALQFDIIHGGASGGFAGAAGAARCQSLIAGALATFNDKGHGTLSGALIHLEGIPTPGPVASCTFKSREPVSPADFSIRVVDAADSEGNKPGQDPQMAVVSVTE